MMRPSPMPISLGATPLPVQEVQGPTPLPVHAVLGPTPIPVHSVDQSGWWLSYGIPVGSLVASFLAALFAGLALRYIGKQIKIANEQTKIATAALRATQDSVVIARQDLDATIESLGATKKALEITVDQAQKTDEIRAQRPVLVASIDYGMEEAYILAEERQKIIVRVHNRGTRPAEDCILRMFFPTAFRDPYEVKQEEEDEEEERRRKQGGGFYVPLPRMGGLRPALRGERVKDLGDPHMIDNFDDVSYIVEDDARRRVVLNVPVIMFIVEVWVPKGEHTVYWEIEAEGMHFPEDRPYGHIKVVASARESE